VLPPSKAHHFPPNGIKRLQSSILTAVHKEYFMSMFLNIKGLARLLIKQQKAFNLESLSFVSLDRHEPNKVCVAPYLTSLQGVFAAHIDRPGWDTG